MSLNSHSRLRRRSNASSGAAVALLQRTCACGQHTVGGEECEQCKGRQQQLQRESAWPTAQGHAPPIVHEVLHSPGQPLDRETRAFMEPHFGHDFSTVRVHADAQAAESARAVNASAYTIGHDVVFDAGRFSPGTDIGRRLLAHELTHVVQQGSGGPKLPDKVEIGRADDGAEREARSVASRFNAGRPHTVQNHTKTVLQGDFTGEDAKKLGIGAAIVGGAVGAGLGIAALAGAFSSKKKPASGPARKTAAVPADKEFVESAIEFLNAAAMNYKADLRIETVTLDDDRVMRQLTGWQVMVEKSEGIIDGSPAPDPTLKKNLRSAYQSAVQALVAFVANRSHTTSHAIFEKYRESIPEWALPQDQPKAKGDELSQALPLGEREQLTVITGSVTFDVDSLFSTTTARTTIPLPQSLTARFSSDVPRQLQAGLRNVAGTIVPKPLVLNSTMTLTLDLEPYGGAYSAYRFTFVEHKPKKGKPTQEVLIEDLGVVGAEGATKSRLKPPQDKFNAHGFRRNSGWSDEQFAKVVTAIGKIPDAILSPVDGIYFARAKASATDADAAGDYNPDKHTITMYDLAFPASTTRFGKPGDISDETVRAVEHEVGHAVDLLPLRKAWANLESKQKAFETAFAQFENPPGSKNYRFPSTEQARFNKLQAQITAAETSLSSARSESGERYQRDKSGTWEMVEGGTAAGSIEFRQAAAKDGGKRITKYSNKEWQEYYAESFSLYMSDPGTLQRLRPNVFAFFQRKHPK